MTTDPFTQAARAEAESWIGMDLDDHDNFVSGAEWARAYLTERCPACGEDPAGPLRPLTTDERSYRYAQDLGYELPEEPARMDDIDDAWGHARAALFAARAARRDKEKR